MENLDSHCVFCAIVSGSGSAEIVYRDDGAVAFLDQRPLFAGHTLVVPTRHAETLADMTDAEVAHVMRVVRALSKVMESGLGAQGSLIAINNRVSQSVPHVHVHVVPRTKGDGLHGFFWPRTKYTDDEHMHQVGELVRDALEGLLEPERAETPALPTTTDGSKLEIR